jgi:16S rRNA G966 N2-methylase RsmD
MQQLFGCNSVVRCGRRFHGEVGLCPAWTPDRMKVRGEKMKEHRLTKIFPLMTDQQFAALKNDIELNGLQEPIWIYKGEILDGRSRHRACSQLGIKPRLRDWTGGGGSLLTFLISANLVRRHLNSSQRAVLALSIEKELAREAKTHMIAGGGDKRNKLVGFKKIQNPMHAAKEAAALAGTNSSYVIGAKRLEAQAPDLLKDVSEGVLNIPDARSLSTLAPEQRRDIVSLLRSGKAKSIKKARYLVRQEQQSRIPDNLPNIGERYRLIHATARELLEGDEIPADSLELVFADPPYDKDSVSVYEDVARLSAKVLKPGGSLLVMAGHCFLPEILKRMTPHISYHWQIAYLLPGAHSQCYQRRASSAWKPVLWFQKGPYAGPYQLDVVTSKRAEKDFHPWQQSVSGMMQLLERFSRPGDRVLDCCAGFGTTAIAALRLNRLFIGSDCDEERIRIIKTRIAECLEEVMGQPLSRAA